MTPSVTVLLAVYNEAGLVEKTVDGIAKEMETLGLPYSVLIANDGSTDWSEDLERRLCSNKNVRVKNFHPNEGKGAALSKAFPLLETDLVVFTDADGEYHASDIPRVLKPLLDDKADCVIGSRYDFGRKRPGQYLATYLVNRAINLWLFVLSGRYFHDILCGLYAMRTGLLSDMRLREKRFSYTGEMCWRLLRKNVRWAQVPVDYTFRTYQSGKKIKWWETFTLLCAMWKYKFQ